MFSLEGQPRGLGSTLYSRDFSDNVEREEDSKGMVELDGARACRWHAQVLFKTKQFGISNVGPIQEGQAEKISLELRLYD
jgi:hypothetical protein